MSERNDQKGAVVIGEGVSLSGVLKVPGRAVIHGDFQGELYAEELTLGLAGKIAGKTHVGKADVQGEIRDELFVTEHLIVRASGRIHGNVAYGEVEVECGGNIQGTLRQGKSEAKEVPTLDRRLPLLGDDIGSLDVGKVALE